GWRGTSGIGRGRRCAAPPIGGECNTSSNVSKGSKVRKVRRVGFHGSAGSMVLGSPVRRRQNAEPRNPEPNLSNRRTPSNPTNRCSFTLFTVMPTQPAVVQYALEPLAVELREIGIPVIEDDDVLLEVGAVSVC